MVQQESWYKIELTRPIRQDKIGLFISTTVSTSLASSLYVNRFCYMCGFCRRVLRLEDAICNETNISWWNSITHDSKPSVWRFS